MFKNSDINIKCKIQFLIFIIKTNDIKVDKIHRLKTTTNFLKYHINVRSNLLKKKFIKGHQKNTNFNQEKNKI